MREFPLVKQAVNLMNSLYDALDKADPYGQAEPDCECDACLHVLRLLMALDMAHGRAIRRADGDYSIVRHYIMEG